jgi:signal transduction histidine kinase
MFAQAGPVAGGSEDGLGIGLTLVRQLAGLHGGSVSAHSHGDGCGSEFRIRLPLQ